MSGYDRGHRGPPENGRGNDRPDRFADRLGPTRHDRGGHRAESYRDRPPSRDYRGRDPSFREPLPREPPIRDVSPRDAPMRDVLPPAPVPLALAAPSLPLQPASQIVVPPPEPQIDREKVCPLLLRVFTKSGGHHQLSEYQVRNQEPKEEVQIYTWSDATLREITELVKEVNPAAKRMNARLEFSFVYPDKRGRNVMRVVGATISGRPGVEEDGKSLKQLNFQTGDFLDVAIW
ncbi:hypothetical protein ABBQ38_014743 [Trebouxia sp. C0009 RCD-2024]